MQECTIVRFDATFDWRQYQGRTAPATALGVALCLGAGILLDQPLAGGIAAGGAVSAGFAAYKRFTRWREAPLALTAFGTGVSAAVGTLAGTHSFSIVILAALAGAALGETGRRHGESARWIVLQSAIALIVASAFAGGAHAALVRGMLVFVGGLVQGLVVTILWALRGEPMFLERPDADPARTERPAWVEPLRTALVASVAVAVAGRLSMQNAYWIPMTALLMMRPTLGAAAQASLERVAGTLAGAGVATALVSFLPVHGLYWALLVAVFSWLTYALQSVNFMAFSACLSALIVLMLSASGPPEMQIAWHRVAATALGALLALLVSEAFDRATRHLPGGSLAQGREHENGS